MKLIGFSSLQQSLVSQHNPNPPPSFIRLRLARLLHKQLFPESRTLDEDTLDLAINQKAISLKQNNPSTNGSPGDDVCRECLIRTHFDQTEALKMLRDNPPNLVCFLRRIERIEQNSIRNRQCLLNRHHHHRY